VSAQLAQLSLSEVSSGIADRRFSALEVTRSCLEQIAAAQARVNCFIAVEAEEALEQARERDRELAAGKRRGPLHGVPLAFKDMFLRKGKVCTFGSRIGRDALAGSTATLIEKLQDAGAVLMGGLNMGEFAISPTGHNEHFGHCRNPWSTERIPGGSSSGSGAAVAARMVPAAIGSDTGGSVRLPAALCGVVGLKPTYGTISRYGAMPRSWSLDTIGPLARTASDCALVMQAVAGPDERDFATRAQRKVDFGRLLSAGIDGVRIGVPGAEILADVEPALMSCLRESLNVLGGAGAQVREVAMPDFRTYYRPANVINKVELSAAHGKWVRTRRADYGKAALARIEGGFHVPATHYLDALRARGRLLEEFVQAVFSQADLLWFPVLGIATPTLDETDYHGAHELPGLVERMTRYTRWTNYLGLPAISVPCGFAGEGMPVGFQLLGRPASEDRLLQVAHQYQEATTWHTKLPPSH